MKLIKLTALSLSFFALLFGSISCERNTEENKVLVFSKSNIVMSFAQEPPASPQTPSAALGSMDVLYSRETRILTYTVRWSGLTSAPILMHIHGLAPVGYPAGVVQTILGAANPALFPATGTYTGSLLIDGVVVKEADLLNGLYYMNIHTTLNPVGEIRGQIVFQ